MTISASALNDLPAQDYDTIRRLVKTGDMALCSGTNPFSRVIRWATKSPWSHIALIVRLEDIDRVIVLEAVAKIGVRAVPLSRFVAEDSDRHRPYPGDIIIARHTAFAEKATGAALHAMTDFAFDRLGAPFDVNEITRIGIRIALAGLGFREPGRIKPDDEYICSEYLAECYRRVGIDIAWDGRGFIGPADFAADPHVEPVARVSHHPF